MHRNARDILQYWYWFYVQHIYSLHNVEVVWYGCPWWCAEQFIVAVVGSDRTNLNPACGLQPQSYYTCGQRPQSSYTTTDRRQHHSIGTTFTINKNCFDDEALWFCNIETLCRCVNVILSELLRILQTSALPKEKMYGQENLIHELCLIQRAEHCIAKYVIESGALYTKSIWRLISDGRCSSPLSSSILPLLPPAASHGHPPPPPPPPPRASQSYHFSHLLLLLVIINPSNIINFGSRWSRSFAKWSSSLREGQSIQSVWIVYKKML